MTDIAAAPPMRKLVDWSAAVRAALVAGTVFLLVDLFVVPALMGGSFWISVRLVGWWVRSCSAGRCLRRRPRPTSARSSPASSSTTRSRSP